MDYLYLYIIGAALLFPLIAFFLSRSEIAIYVFFAAGLSIQYFELITFGNVSTLDIVGIGIPFLLFISLFFDKKKNTIREFTKDITIPLYFCLCTIVFLDGILLSNAFYPERTPYDFYEQFGFVGKYFNGFFVLWIVSAFCDDKTKVNRMLSCMLFCLVIPGAIGCWEILTGTTRIHGTVGYPMPWAFFHHPGVIAYGFITLLPVALFKRSLASGFKSKTFWTSVAILMIVFIYFTYRRTVWLGLIIQLFMWFLLFQKTKYKFINSYLTTLLLIAVFIFGTLLTFSFQDRLGDIATFFNNIPAVFTSDQYNYLFTGRWEFFRGYLIYITNQPVINMILGNGVGSTAYAAWSAAQSAGGAHNCYAILLIEFGLISLILYMVVAFFLYWKSLRLLRSNDSFNRQYAKFFMTLLTSYLVMGLGTHIFYELTSGVWIFWGIVAGLLVLSRQQKMKNTQVL